MFKALFYKEWVKTKRIILLLGIIFAGLIIYTFINTGQMFRVNGAVATWGNIILKDMGIMPSIVQWLPLLAGLILAFSQYTPEVTNKRLKLTLHLPLPETKTISIMLLYGLLVLFFLFILTYAVLVIGFASYYPSEIITATMYKSLPWFLSGLLGYILVAWICLEPVWKQRIFNSIIALSTISFYYISAKSGAYITFIPYLIIIMIICFGFPFFSTARFKEGAQ